MGGAASCCEAERDFPVKVHVYDLAPDGGSALLGALTGGGGVYHSGVEVGGVEYAFGDKSGVWTQQPARLPASFGAPAAYKRAEDCGVARLTPSALRRIVRQLRAEWDRHNEQQAQLDAVEPCSLRSGTLRSWWPALSRVAEERDGSGLVHSGSSTPRSC